MSVKSIQRNFNDSPQIVNMNISDTLATAAATGWLGLPSTIASITAANNGLWVWEPSDLVLLQASDGDKLFTLSADLLSLLQYSTAGNGAVTLPVVSNDFVNFDGTLGALKDSGYSPSDATKTKVVMAGSAVQVGYIAHFVDTAGTIDDTAGTVQNDGSIQAGKSGVAGSLISFPVTALEGSLILAAVSNGAGNFTTTISNAASVGQSQVISIPDSGAATANFLLSSSSGASQTISSGNLIVSNGNVQAGSSGHAGTLASFPAGAASGELILAAVTNGSGNFNTTISNASAIGQSQVISIPDAGSATANFILSKSAGTQHITAGNLQVDAGNLLAGSSGSAGTVASFPATAGNGELILAAVDAGGAFNTTISNSTMGQSTVYSIPDVGAATGKILVNASQGLMKSVTAAVVAGGNASQTITDAFCTATSTVVANWNTQTNPASILTVTPGVGSFVVVSSADPGASTLGYIILK